MSYEFIFQIWRRYHEKWDFSETIYELIHSKVNTFTECLMSTYRIWEPAVGNERPLLLHTNHFPHVIKAGVIRHQVVERRLVFFYNSCRITVDENNESLNVHLENSLIYIVLQTIKHFRTESSELTITDGSASDLPQHQPKGPDVHPLIGIKTVCLNGLI